MQIVVIYQIRFFSFVRNGSYFRCHNFLGSEMEVHWAFQNNYLTCLQQIKFHEGCHRFLKILQTSQYGNQHMSMKRLHIYNYPPCPHIALWIHALWKWQLLWLHEAPHTRMIKATYIYYDLKMYIEPCSYLLSVDLVPHCFPLIRRNLYTYSGQTHWHMELKHSYLTKSLTVNIQM